MNGYTWNSATSSCVPTTPLVLLDRLGQEPNVFQLLQHAHQVKHGLELNVFQLLEIAFWLHLVNYHLFMRSKHSTCQLDLLGMEINVLLPEALTAHHCHHGMELLVFLPLFIALGSTWSGSGWLSISCKLPIRNFLEWSHLLFTRTDCSSGFTWNGSTCVYNGQLTYVCNSGFSWNGLCCVQDPVPIPTCPSGQYYNGLMCISIHLKLSTQHALLDGISTLQVLAV